MVDYLVRSDVMVVLVLLGVYSQRSHHYYPPFQLREYITPHDNVPSDQDVIASYIKLMER